MIGSHLVSLLSFISLDCFGLVSGSAFHNFALRLGILQMLFGTFHLNLGASLPGSLLWTVQVPHLLSHLAIFHEVVRASEGFHGFRAIPR